MRVASEQELALAGAVRGLLPTVDDGALPRPYSFRRGGRTFVCPVDMTLRSWLSLNTSAAALGDAATALMPSAADRARSDEAFARWRRDHPAAVPHIRQATWGVPRSWFLLVVEEERESYDANGHAGVRYRARIGDARRRLTRAHAVLSSVIDDIDIHEELVDLGGWLAAFDDDGWVELDYAGVARLLGTTLDSDRSALDVHTAIGALKRGDLAAAGEAYRRFERRWRLVNAYERAN